MLIAGVIAFGFGLLEFWLNTLLFPAVFEKNYTKMGLAALLKLALYGVGISLLIVKFRAYTIPAAVGFGAGFLVYLVAYGIVQLTKKDG